MRSIPLFLVSLLILMAATHISAYPAPPGVDIMALSKEVQECAKKIFDGITLIPHFDDLNEYPPRLKTAVADTCEGEKKPKHKEESKHARKPKGPFDPKR